MIDREKLVRLLLEQPWGPSHPGAAVDAADRILALEEGEPPDDLATLTLTPQSHRTRRYTARLIREDVSPGLCGASYPYAEIPYFCELVFGHDGMHQCNDWRSIPAGQIGIPQIATWTAS